MIHEGTELHVVYTGSRNSRIEQIFLSLPRSFCLCCNADVLSLKTCVGTLLRDLDFKMFSLKSLRTSQRTGVKFDLCAFFDLHESLTRCRARRMSVSRYGRSQHPSCVTLG